MSSRIRMHVILSSYWHKYKYIILVAAIPALSVTFMFVPQEVFIDSEGYKVYITHEMFPLTKSKCTYQEYVYYADEHFQFIIFSYISFLLSNKVNLFRGVLVYLILDAVDYFLTYNEVWYHYVGIPFSFNTIGWIIIPIFTLFYRGKNGSSHRHPLV